MSLYEEIEARRGLPLDEAKTLPGAWYADAAHHQLELEKVFRRHWVAVAAEADVATAGTYLSVLVGGVTPVLLVRDEARTLRGFLNVCRHRSAPVAEGSGRCHALSCPYHGWVYRLDGSLAKCQGVGEPAGFERDAYGLFPVQTTTFAGFVLVNLDPAAAPFDPGTLVAGLAAYPLAELQRAERRTWEHACNWKVLLENYSENYHTPFIHPQLPAAGWDYPIVTNGLVSYAWDRPQLPTGEAEEALARSRPDADGWHAVGSAVRDDTYSVGSYLTLFPNLMLNVFPDSMQSLLMIPTGPTSTLVHRDFFWLASVGPERRAEDIAGGSLVHEQDIAICEAVQRSYSGGLSPEGVLSTVHESGVAFVHQVLLEALAR